MIECLLTFDHYAIRGGYYKLGHKMKTDAIQYQMPLMPSYHSTSDEGYVGRHPFNILTEEIYDDIS